MDLFLRQIGHKLGLARTCSAAMPIVEPIEASAREASVIQQYRSTWRSALEG